MNRVPASRYWAFGLLASGALAWDLVSKHLVFEALGFPGRSSDWSYETPFLWGTFSIRLTTWLNQGALFGMGQGFGWLFAALSVVAALGIVYWLFVHGGAQSWWLTITLALIFAGAAGNLFDRLYLHGCVDALGQPMTGVRDFIRCDIPLIEYRWPLRFRLIERYPWPIFNFADTYLVVGAVMLTLYSLFAPQPETKAEKSAVPAPHTAISAC